MKVVQVSVTSVATFKTTLEVPEELLSHPDELAGVVRSKASEMTGERSKIAVDVPGRWLGGEGIRAVPAKIEY